MKVPPKGHKICEAMSISAATVRTHKFNLQKMKRGARVFGNHEQIENEELVAARKRLDLQEDAHTLRKPHFDPVRCESPASVLYAV